ncbi:Nucleotide-binding alpha-beta plait domain containing protein [Trema orientale]|uniref:Nucleotide-binding alpha-beta plait domain containing protein n=1 Tax=Trema orientale TaxID=63057 RepID=A0A2P5D3D7_TREOI|nr:Nucleotide-binding alpha-beta plait domain containing protein [Trema orientale]
MASSQANIMISTSTKPLNPNATPFHSKSRGTTHVYLSSSSLLPQPFLLGQPAFFGFSYGDGPVTLHQRASATRCRRTTRPRARVPKVWMRKTTRTDMAFPPAKVVCGGGLVVDEKRSSIIPFPSTLDDLRSAGCTTVMIRNIPNQFSRDDLLKILDMHCRSENKGSSGVCSKYNFLYLPMDFNQYWFRGKVANLGYAFVNFTSAVGAWRFHNSFHNYNWRVPRNNKICEVTVAKIQGIGSLMENFRSKMFFCHSDKYLPVMFKPACDGNSSAGRGGREIGRRVATAPRHPLIKRSIKALAPKV